MASIKTYTHNMYVAIYSFVYYSDPIVDMLGVITTEYEDLPNRSLLLDDLMIF